MPLPRPLCPAPTRRLPSNAGTASEDTEAGARSPRPLRPICCIALSLRSQHPELSVDAYGSFTSASSVCDMLCIFNTMCVRLSSTFFHPRWTIVDRPCFTAVLMHQLARERLSLPPGGSWQRSALRGRSLTEEECGQGLSLSHLCGLLPSLQISPFLFRPSVHTGAPSPREKVLPRFRAGR